MASFLASSSATSSAAFTARASAQQRDQKTHHCRLPAPIKASLSGTTRPQQFLGHKSGLATHFHSQRGRTPAAASDPQIIAEVVDEEIVAEEVVAEEAEFKLKGEVDTAAMLAASTFPIPPEELILKTKKYLACLFGVRDPSTVAEDFRFVAPVVGPLDKATFLNAIGSFEVEEAFPDYNPQYHDFRVDPFEPNRVWLTARGVGTNTGKFAGALPATDKVVIAPPQTLSVTFNEEGLVSKYTIGYVMDREVGNTGGLGGVYGLIYGIYPNLLMFPEAQPWSPSPQYQFFQFTTGGAGKVFSFISGMMNK